MNRVLVVLTLLLCPAVARADFQFVIGNGSPITVVQGQNYSIPVFMTSHDGSTVSVDSFNMAIDLGGDSFGIPTVFSNLGISSASSPLSFSQAPSLDLLTAPLYNTAALPVNWDLKVNATMTSTVNFNSSTKLFDLTFTAANNFSGSIPVSVVMSPQPLPQDTQAIFGIGTIPMQAAVNGLLVSAVPEPATTGLLGMGLVGLCGMVRRRFGKKAGK